MKCKFCGTDMARSCTRSVHGDYDHWTCDECGAEFDPQEDKWDTAVIASDES